MYFGNSSYKLFEIMPASNTTTIIGEIILTILKQSPSNIAFVIDIVLAYPIIKRRGAHGVRP